MAQVTLRGVKKTYDNKVAVIHGIDMEIADGEFIVIVGPSGCGKSTLLRMVAGLEKISGGEVSIGKRMVNHLEPKDRDIAMVFQNYALYPHMTVFDNMAYGLKIRKFAKPEIDLRVRKAARMLELEALLQRRPRQLSGGQRQRVAMGCALVREPAVFLFDEPLSNLDAKLRVQMRLEIKRLQRELGVTSIYVTHDQVEAMTLADRLIVMNKGRVEQVGTPTDIYRRPASLFVASFIGSPAMNLLPGQLASDGTSLVMEGGFELPLRKPRPEWGGRELTVGIRPEHIQLSDDRDTGIPLNLTTLELLGADNLAHGKWAGSGVVVRLNHENCPEPGTQLRLVLPTNALHFFDSHSGSRME